MMTEFDEGKLETPGEWAAFWYLRLSSDECTPEDRYEFEAWKREASENAAAYEKVVRGNAFIDRHVAEPAMRRIGKETLARTASPLHRRRRTQFAALAASLVLAVGVGVLATIDRDPSSIAALAEIESYETAIGERSTVTLSDGSTVTLNTNSRIEVAFSAQERNVRLMRGQGFFDVQKDADRPFAVEAGDKRVVALGTAFDVRFDDGNDVQVTLVEGRVSVGEVVRTATNSVAITPPNPKPIAELIPGQRLVAKADAAPEVIETNAEEATSWREGRLIFRGEPIGDVIEEMNRYSAQKLKLSNDPRLQEMRVSGVFNTGRASTFVDALERMHPLEAKRSASNELTLVWQE